MKRSIRIDNPAGIATKTTVTDAETGAEIHGIRRLVVTYDTKQPLVIAEVEIGLPSSAELAAAQFRCIDPATGALKALRRIEFADGSSWSPGDPVVEEGEEEEEISPAEARGLERLARRLMGRRK